MSKNNINIKDIPIQFQELAEDIGISNFIKLCNLLGGTLVYIPSLKTLEKNSRNESILKEFNGANYKELSRKYRISEPYIRKLIKQNISK